MQLSACLSNTLAAILQHKAHLIFNCDVGAGVVGDVHLQRNWGFKRTLSSWRCSRHRHDQQGKRNKEQVCS